MRPEADAPMLELPVEAFDGGLELGPLDAKLQVAKAQRQQLLIGQPFPGGMAGTARCGAPAFRAPLRPDAHGAGTSRASASRSSRSGTAAERCLSSAPKSNSAGSHNCEAATCLRLEKIDSVRPGCSRSHCSNIARTARRLRCGCEQQSVQGMIGKRRAAA